MYFTTGKKPGREALALAKALASAVPGSVYRQRGRKSIANIASVCRRMSFSRACIVHSPSKLAQACELLFLGVRRDSHGWLPVKFGVSKFRAGKATSLPDDCGFEAQGEMEPLFESADSLSDEKVVLSQAKSRAGRAGKPASASKSDFPLFGKFSRSVFNSATPRWVFKFGKKTLLSMEGSHEKIGHS